MQVKRLIVLAALVLPSLGAGTQAQTSGKVYRIGFLTPGAAAAPASQAAMSGLKQQFKERGYADGSVVIEGRFGEGNSERLPALVKELADAKCDVIVTTGYPAARAAKEGTPTIPIVMTNGGDPVETGLAASFGRPGGNVTGISDMASELSAKRLELLNEAVPGLKRVAMLYNADDAGMITRYKAAEAAAKTLGLGVQALGVREPDDFAVAFDAMTRERPDGIMMVTDVLTILNRKKVFDFAATHNVPAVFEFDFLARDGGLMSYGPDGKEMTARTADLVDRILKGAKPADLPFEQPTRFNFAVNLKTAQALGLKLPRALLARADEVIE